MWHSYSGRVVNLIEILSWDSFIVIVIHDIDRQSQIDFVRKKKSFFRKITQSSWSLWRDNSIKKNFDHRIVEPNKKRIFFFWIWWKNRDETDFRRTSDCFRKVRTDFSTKPFYCENLWRTWRFYWWQSFVETVTKLGRPVIFSIRFNFFSTSRNFILLLRRFIIVSNRSSPLETKILDLNGKT